MIRMTIISITTLMKNENVDYVSIIRVITIVNEIIIFDRNRRRQTNSTNFVTWCWSNKNNSNSKISIFFISNISRIKISLITWSMRKKSFILTFNCLFKQSNNTWSTIKMFWNIYIFVCAMQFKYDEQIKNLRINSFIWSRLIFFAMF